MLYAVRGGACWIFEDLRREPELAALRRDRDSLLRLLNASCEYPVSPDREPSPFESQLRRVAPASDDADGD